MTADEIVNIIAERYPEATAETDDNVGRIIGAFGLTVEKVLVTLDFSDDCLKTAEDGGYGLIVTHHPPIFKPISRVSDETPLTRRVISLIKRDIALYTAHTNFDTAEDGTSATLARIAGIKDLAKFIRNDNSTGYFGRYGALNEPTTLGKLSRRLSLALNCDLIRFYGDSQRVITAAGVCAGSGMRTAWRREAQALGCGVYITGDVKYHDAQAALDDGIAVIDVTHDGGETPAVRLLAASLSESLSKYGVAVDFFEQGISGKKIL